MSGLYRFGKVIAFIYVHLCFRFRVVGKENFPKSGGIVLCCNHQSYNDIFLLGKASSRQLHFMGKEELFKNRFIKWLFYKLGSFSVKRGSGDSGALDFAKKIVNEQRVFTIFPEGTRSRDGQMLRAKSGAAVVAASCGAPILPAAIKYSKSRHVFCRATVAFGKPIEVKMEEASRGEIRRVSTEIMDSIKELYNAI